MSEIPMSSRLAGHLVTFSTFAAAVGAFILSADEVPFGLDAYDVGLSLVWAGTIANFAVVAIRRNAVPGITTGIGTEPIGETQTSSVTVTKTTDPGSGESGDFNVGGSGILGLIAVILIILVCIVWLWLNIDVSDDPGAAIEAARTLAA